MQKFLISTLVIGSLVFAGFVFLSASRNTVPSVATGEQQLGMFSSDQELVHNWGDINIMGGDVSKAFTLTNRESEPLHLRGAVTSCMCTTAEFVLDDGSRSGAFGMHGGPDWSHVVQPGESFEVLVTFDPLAHGPDATGPILRTVNVIGQSNPDLPGAIYTRIDVQGDVLAEEDFNRTNNA